VNFRILGCFGAVNLIIAPKKSTFKLKRVFLEIFNLLPKIYEELKGVYLYKLVG